ncbi:sulfite exporter TauE/SafE family protein [Rhodopirellula sp.]|nr:sulfite exporter TauE/SafE family protein [Rhodopirellula sp.]
MEIDLTLLGILAVIAFFAGFIHSAIGFGFGIVAISLLPFFIDGRSAHVIVSISSVPMLMMAAWAYRDGVDWRSLRPALLGAAIFLPLGFALFERLPLDLLVRGTGAGILGMVWMSLRAHEPNSTSDRQSTACFIAGAAGGFLAGAVSIAGPPVAAFGLKQGWPQNRFKAFVTQCLIIMAFYKVGLLFMRGHVTVDSGWSILTIGILSIMGVQAGVLASRRISPTRFKRLVAITLISVSCLMMYRGQPKQEEARDIPTSKKPATPVKMPVQPSHQTQ